MCGSAILRGSLLSGHTHEVFARRRQLEETAIDREDTNAIMTGLMTIDAKLDEVLRELREEDGYGEEEADGF
jgi:hypothetical protein